MPEAPEVQTVLSTLETQIKNISIEDVLNEMGFPLNYKEIMYYE